MKITKILQVGMFRVQLNEEEVVTMPRNAQRELEKVLDTYPTSSLLVRVDMSPWEGVGAAPIYEIETVPGGLMFNFPRFPWHELVPMVDTAICLDPKWASAYQRLAELTGWSVRDSWVRSPKPLYFSGNKEDIPDWVSDNLLTDPWSSKASICSVTGGELIEAETTDNFGVLGQKYPNGFVVKPVWGWGARDIYMYPLGGPCVRWARPKKEIKQVIKKARSVPGDWMIQPFFAPEQVFWGEFRIWRVYAVRQSRDSRFRLLGGTWNLRPAIKIHGASNTIVGEVKVVD